MQAEQVRPPVKDESESDWNQIVVALLIVSIVISICVWCNFYLLIPRLSAQTPTGGVLAEVTSNTTAEFVVARLATDPPVTKLEIEMRVGTNTSMYSFGSSADGTNASLDSGPYLGTITYRDFADNNKANSGDRFLMTDLRKNSEYIIRLIWAPNGDTIEMDSFITPP